MTRKEASRVWFLRNGNHLTRGPLGTGGDEYGRKTWWLHLGFGVLVVASKDVRYPEVDNLELPR